MLHFILATVLLIGSASSTDIKAVSDAAVQSARAWLASERATGRAPEDARLGPGYVVVSLSARRIVDFLQLDRPWDAADLANVLGATYFPIIVGDTLFSHVNIDQMHDGTLFPLGPFIHEPSALDGIVMAVDRLVANDSHRVWIVDGTPPIFCKTVIAQAPNGMLTAFELGNSLDVVPGDEALLASGELAEEWSRRYRRRLRSAHGFDQSIRPRSHEIPEAARRVADDSRDQNIVRDQMRRLGVSGPSSLGRPMIEYRLDAVEQLLYALSDELDPTLFDTSPLYLFPVIVDGTTVFTMTIHRSSLPCGALVESDSTEFEAGGGSQGGRLDRIPSHVARLGDVAILNLLDFDRYADSTNAIPPRPWFHIVNGDSIWVAPYFARPDGRVVPLAAMVARLKEQILARNIE